MGKEEKINRRKRREGRYGDVRERKGRKQKENTGFQFFIDMFKNHPKTMAQWIVILFSSNTMDESAQPFLPIYVILGYRHPRCIKIQDDKVTGLTMVPTAVRRLSQTEQPQSVCGSLCSIAVHLVLFSAWQLGVGSRGSPSSLRVGPEVHECHFPYIIMVRAHHKDHSNSGGEISSAS